MPTARINQKNRQNSKRRRWVHPILSTFLAVGILFLPVVIEVQAASLLDADFNSGTEGFSYADDTFFGTGEPSYASGSRLTGAECYGGSGGCLNVRLGSSDSSDAEDMSGGWSYDLVLGSAASGLSLSLRHRLVMPDEYDYDEYSRVLVSLDGTLFGRGAKDYVDHTGGDNYFSHDTGWVQSVLYLGDLDAGTHTLILGGFSNEKNQSGEITDIYFDDVVLTSDNPAPTTSDAQTVVDRLSLDNFKSNILTLSNFGDRCHRVPDCAPYTSYFQAQSWVNDQLESWGYETFTHEYVDGSYEGVNLYATKVGTMNPDQMYIVAGHLDGRGGGGAADDNGSTVALILELARVLASPDVETDISVRFIFWDQEEWGLYGSRNYVSDRRLLQGIEDPPGSGEYPEPTWLGNITHDMVLYDHGVGSPTAEQSPYADLDVEWRRSTTFEAQSKALAQTWRYLNGEYAPDYPANSADYSTNTDDTPFHNYCPSISVRENRRRSTYGEWINPYYHNTGDVYASYIEDDFLLGFNAVQTTTGVVAELAGVQIVVVNNPPIADSQSVSTDEDTAVAITLTGSDPDEDPITFAVSEDPDHGTLAGTAPDLSYTPDANYNGPDSFSFTVNDGTVDSDPAEVSITVNPVNDPPVANPQSLSTNEDTALAITLTGSDIDDDPLDFSVVAPPDHGSLSGDAPNLTYTPDAEYSGPDSFTFKANDGTVDSPEATVSITVDPVNDPPVADPQSVSTDMNTPIPITLTGSDQENDPLDFEVNSGPSHGGLSGTSPTFTYTPDTDYTGLDSFQFVAYDGENYSDPATVFIAVETTIYTLPFVDDFESDLGWMVDPYGSDTSRSGSWERGNPQGTSWRGPKQLDITTSETQNLVTGAKSGWFPGSNDLDGVSSIHSPLIQLPASSGISLTFNYYFAHASNASGSDFFRVKVVGDTTLTVLAVTGTSSDVDAGWIPYQVSLDEFSGQTIRILVEAGDRQRSSLVEAALDDLSIVATVGGGDLVSASFDTGPDGFGYLDDAFRETSEPDYADGAYLADAGFNGGGLKVQLGGLDTRIIRGISGGWFIPFTLSGDSDVRISFWYQLTQSPDYDPGEVSQVLVRVDDVLYGAGTNDFVAQIEGNGNGGIPETTGWQLFSIELSSLPAGEHTLVIGGYNNQKSYTNEFTEIQIDQVRVTLP